MCAEKKIGKPKIGYWTEAIILGVIAGLISTPIYDYYQSRFNKSINEESALPEDRKVSKNTSRLKFLCLNQIVKKSIPMKSMLKYYSVEEVLKKIEFVIKQEDYLEALNWLSKVVGVDINDQVIKSEVEKYKTICKNNIFNIMDKSIRKLDFEEAYALNEIIMKSEVYSGDFDLIDKLKEIQKSELEYRIGNMDNNKTILETILSYKSLESDVDVISLKIEYAKRYTQELKDICYYYLDNSQYDKAIGEINEAYDILSDNKELDEIKQEIEQYKPMKLTELDYFDMEYGGSVWHTTMKKSANELDSKGVNHTDIIKGGRFTYTYLIDGKYDLLSGDIFMVYEYRTIKKTAYIEVIGDGNLIDRKEVSAGVEPLHFDISITGVDELKVTFNGYDGSWTTGTKYYGALSNVVLRKKR